MLLRSAQRELDTHDTAHRLSWLAAPGSAVEEQPSLTIRDGKAVALDWDAFVKTITRMKSVPALPYIGAADTAKHWRIRHGAFDRDTSLAIPAILAAVLENRGYDVDFFFPWGLPHSGDYDTEELFRWIDRICGKDG